MKNATWSKIRKTATPRWTIASSGVSTAIILSLMTFGREENLLCDAYKRKTPSLLEMPGDLPQIG
jgi:hypothetical protein